MLLVDESIQLHAEAGISSLNRLADARYDEIVAAYEYEIRNALSHVNANLKRLFPTLELEVRRVDE